MGFKQFSLRIYDVHYKKLMIFSFLVLLACMVSLGVTYARTGELFQKGVSLKGGITMTIPVSHNVDSKAIEAALAAKFPAGDISVREITEGATTSALIVEAADVSAENLESALPELGVELEKDKYSVESMGSSLGQRFYSQTIKAVAIAFVSMAVVVFITFRSTVPSSFVVLAAFSDVVSTIAVISLMGMKMSTAGIAALLMLIGYSVDTDILLTTKVLKRKSEGGTIFQRTIGALRTGVTMTSTALVASIIGMIFTRSDMIRQIMTIVTIGLVFDLIYTWFQNAGILRLYMERKEKEHGGN